MTVSTKTQETQAKVLVGMQRRAAYGMTGAQSARYLGALFNLSQQSVAAALKLLEDKGLVQRLERGVTRDAFGRKHGHGTRWFLTSAGHQAEVK